jgi:hypothetical protein
MARAVYTTENPSLGPVDSPDRFDTLLPSDLGSGEPSVRTILWGDGVWKRPYPLGIVTYHSDTVAPPGWLLTNGAAVSRTAFSTYFALVGTRFGVGDGSTTFNVPTVTSVGSCVGIVFVDGPPGYGVVPSDWLRLSSFHPTATPYRPVSQPLPGFLGSVPPPPAPPPAPSWGYLSMPPPPIYKPRVTPRPVPEPGFLANVPPTPPPPAVPTWGYASPAPLTPPRKRYTPPGSPGWVGSPTLTPPTTPTLRATAVGNANASSLGAIAFGVTANAGDLILLFLGDPNVNTPTTPSGYTLYLTRARVGGQIRVYYKVAAGGETGTPAVSYSGSGATVGTTYLLSGASPPEASAGADGATIASLAVPSLTTLGTNRFLASAFLASYPTGAPPAGTWTAPSGQTSTSNISSDDGSTWGIIQRTGYETVAAAGATGTRTGSKTGGTYSALVGVSVAVSV